MAPSAKHLPSAQVLILESWEEHHESACFSLFLCSSPPFLLTLSNKIKYYNRVEMTYIPPLQHQRILTLTIYLLLLVILIHSCFYLVSILSFQLKELFSISCKANVMMMHSYSFCLFGNVFIYLLHF